MKNPFAKNKRSDYESYEDYDAGFYRGDEDEEDGVVDDLGENTESQQPAKRPTQSAATGNMLKVVKPRNYDDGPAIAGYLMDGYTVVMNIEDLERASAMRLIDFLLGALEVLDGEFRRVTKTTLVLSPRSGEVTGEDGDEEY
ncbi:MAG: cell division protein SepF [Ruminococcaceae bacterium]|nr:cell division protein SepF [Oscillospiraceae bacterium]MBQ2758039.1 cell division protein SepF [Clostridia bacterium]